VASPRGSYSVDDLLADLVIEARITFRGLACTRWGIAGGSGGRIGFHAILSGECWVRTPDSDTAVRASAGGFLLYRPTTEHLLAHSPDISEPQSPVRLAPLSSAHPALSVGLLCGYFDGGAANVALVNTLPKYVFWPSAAACPEPIAALLKVIDICSHGPSASPAFVLERLLESLLIMVLRTVAVPREALGVVRANRHPQLQRLLTAVHRQPDRRWTVRSMAQLAGLSRSAFAELFHREVGESPARYLQNYRLTLAARLTRQGRLSIDKIARQCGYRNTAAFRRRFRRSMPDGA
jgi:AraC family transcriptional regulator, activator of mtrCDE